MTSRCEVFAKQLTKTTCYARLAYRAKLMPQFLWSSLHCLEKYVKCILVLNRVDARRVKHEITGGLARLSTHGNFQVNLSDRVASFVSRLESGARFRYYETSYYAEELDLTKLDRAVWEIRRYCQPPRLRHRPLMAEARINCTQTFGD